MLPIGFVASRLAEARGCLVMYTLGIDLVTICYKVTCTDCYLFHDEGSQSVQIVPNGDYNAYCNQK